MTSRLKGPLDAPIHVQTDLRAQKQRFPCPNIADVRRNFGNPSNIVDSDDLEDFFSRMMCCQFEHLIQVSSWSHELRSYN